MTKEARDILRYFDEHMSRLKQLEKRVHHHPSLENVHDLRVEVRRILSIARIFGLPRSRILTGLARQLGKLRDLDTGILNARKFHLDSFHLERDRESRRHDIVKGTRGKERRLVSEELERVRSKLKKKVGRDLEGLLQDFNDSFNERFRISLSEKNAHELRIFLKRARYFLEALNAPVDELINLQDKLGEVHDLEVMMDFYGHFPDIEKVKRSLLKEASTIKKGISPGEKGLESFS